MHVVAQVALGDVRTAAPCDDSHRCYPRVSNSRIIIRSLSYVGIQDRQFSRNLKIARHVASFFVIQIKSREVAETGVSRSLFHRETRSRASEESEMFAKSTLYKMSRLGCAFFHLSTHFFSLIVFPTKIP